MDMYDDPRKEQDPSKVLAWFAVVFVLVVGYVGWKVFNLLVGA